MMKETKLRMCTVMTKILPMVKEDDEAVEVQSDDEDAANREEDDEADEVQSKDEDTSNRDKDD